MAGVYDPASASARVDKSVAGGSLSQQAELATHASRLLGGETTNQDSETLANIDSHGHLWGPMLRL